LKPEWTLGQRLTETFACSNCYCNAYPFCVACLSCAEDGPAADLLASGGGGNDTVSGDGGTPAGTGLVLPQNPCLSCDCTQNWQLLYGTFYYRGPATCQPCCGGGRSTFSTWNRYSPFRWFNGIWRRRK
jgi:hypothetical protein